MHQALGLEYVGGSQRVVPGPVAAVLPRSLLKRQILRPLLKATKSEMCG